MKKFNTRPQSNSHQATKQVKELLKTNKRNEYKNEKHRCPIRLNQTSAVATVDGNDPDLDAKIFNWICRNDMNDDELLLQQQRKKNSTQNLSNRNV